MSQTDLLPDFMQTKVTDLIHGSSHILVLKDLNEQKIYYKKVFPKETHFEKKEETIYQEFISKCQVIKILKSKTLKVNDIIWIRKNPDYNESLIKISHEQGVLESPFVDSYTSTFDVARNEDKIFYLVDIENPKVPDTYNNFHSAVDGIRGVGEIKRLIDKLDSPKSPLESNKKK